MRIWRNWQTRRFQVPVGDRAGSTPVIRTKKAGRDKNSACLTAYMRNQRTIEIYTSINGLIHKF